MLSRSESDSDTTYQEEESLIEQLEKQSEFWRQNYYKPWRYLVLVDLNIMTNWVLRYPFVTRLFPNLSTKIEMFGVRVATIRKSIMDDSDSEDDVARARRMSSKGGDITNDMILAQMQKANPKKSHLSTNIDQEAEMMRRVSARE